MNLVNSKSFSKRVFKKLNFLNNNYIKYFRSDSLIFFRENLLIDFDNVELSILNNILPKVDKDLLKTLFQQVKSISFLWRKITISSLHFSSIKTRLLLHSLRNVSKDKCKIYLFNEHGSSFFKTSHHTYSFEKNVFNANTIYRKNYP